MRGRVRRTLPPLRGAVASQGLAAAMWMLAARLIAQRGRLLAPPLSGAPRATHVLRTSLLSPFQDPSRCGGGARLASTFAPHAGSAEGGPAGEEGEPRKPGLMADIGKLVTLYAPEKGRLGAALAALTVSSGITLAVPAGMGYVIDTVANNSGALPCASFRGPRAFLPRWAAFPRLVHVEIRRDARRGLRRRLADDGGGRTFGAVRRGRDRQLFALVPTQHAG